MCKHLYPKDAPAVYENLKLAEPGSRSVTSDRRATLVQVSSSVVLSLDASEREVSALWGASCSLTEP